MKGEKLRKYLTLLLPYYIMFIEYILSNCDIPFICGDKESYLNDYIYVDDI